MLRRCLCVSIAVLLVILPAYNSTPLSSSGCSCTSGCDKSWVGLGSDRSQFEWCYVAASCQSAGWDWCNDTQSLYAKAVQEKDRAERLRQHEESQRKDAERQKFLEAQKRRDAEVQAAAMREQLEEATRKKKDAEIYAAALSSRLTLKEHSEAKAQWEDLTNKTVGAKLDGPSSEDLFQGELKLSGHLQDAEVMRRAAEAESMRREAEAKLHSAAVHHQQQLEAADRKIKQSETRRKDAERKAAAARTQLEGALRKQASTQQKAANTERVLKRELKEASLKGAMTETNLHNVQTKLHKTETNLDKSQAKLRAAKTEIATDQRYIEDMTAHVHALANTTLHIKLSADEDRERRKAAELRTFRLAMRGAVRGGTGIVQRDGKVEKHLLR